MIKTDRLYLRQWAQEDLEPFARICSDPDVMRYVGRGDVRSREQTEEAITSYQRRWRNHGYGLFAVELMSGEFIGFAGLSEPTFLPEILPAIELGWRFARAHWNRGYATEAGDAILRLSFGELRLREVVSIHQLGNVASARVMQKLGMRFDHSTLDRTSGRRVCVYRIRNPLSRVS